MEFTYRAFDKRINKMYPYVVLGWCGAIEARLIDKEHTSIADIRFNHANGTFEDYDGEIVVMPYMNRTDKTGKQLADGDIFEIDFKVTRFLKVVKYCNERNAFVIAEVSDLKNESWRDIWGVFSVTWWDTFGTKSEIVGNIHQNKELLK